jgi:Mg-chelatase subunit ChlD
VFTGALITLLTEGVPDRGDPITLDSAVAYLRGRMRAANYPNPRYTRTGRIGELVLASNAARTGVPDAPPALAVAAARRAPGGWLAALAGAVLAGPALAAAAQQTLAWTPSGARGWLPAAPWRWGLLIVLTAVAAVALARWLTTRTANRIARWTATSAVPWSPRGIGRWRPARRAAWRLVAPDRRILSWRRMLSLALPLVLAVLLGGGTLQLAGFGRVLLTGCPPPAHISVLTTPESYEAVLRLRDAYERTGSGDDLGCPVTRIHVGAAPAEFAATLLRARWSDEARLAVGPSPDIWLPDSSIHVATVEGVAPIAEMRSIATSPIVLATPSAGLQASEAATLLPATGDILGALIAGAETLGRPVVMPEPTSSVAGALARAPIYANEPDVGVAFEKQLDRSRTDAGFPAGADVAALLCRYDETRPAVALLVPEHAAVQFNRGHAISPTCGGARTRSDARLRLSYPSRTAILDHPLVRLTWPDRSSAQLAAAERFGDWLASPDGGRALAGVGLRPPGFVSGGALTIDHGAQPGAQFTQVPLDAALRERIAASYRVALRPGRVLLALDGSGSMRTAATGSARRWDVAARAVTDAVALMGPADQLGLWVFQGDNAAGVRRLVPIGLRDVPVGGLSRTAAIDAALSGVVVGGRTPLYAAVTEGVQEVGPTNDDRVTAVVVLTDGEDDNASGLSAARYAEAVSGGRAQVWVVAIGEASCTAVSLRALPASTGGRCVEASGAVSGTALAGVLRALWRG